MSRVFILIFLVAFIATSSFAQKEKKQKKEELMAIREEWYEGSIMTADQEELKGLVWYNDTNGVLSYRDGSNARVFTARSAVGFEFFDEKIQKQRIFYSIEYEDPDQPGGKRPYFFEALQDFTNFAVLAKTNPVEIQLKGGNGGMTPDGYMGLITPGSHSYTEVSQMETIFFLNSNGVIEPYLKVTKKEFVGRLLINENEKKKLVDESLFAKYITKPVYDRLVAFAKENDLKFRDKDDFLIILNHYAENYAE